MFPLAVMLPINSCVSVTLSPNIFEPEVKITDDEIEEIGYD